jgi:hypothetical protein
MAEQETPQNDGVGVAIESVTTALLSTSRNPANIKILRCEMENFYGKTRSWREVGLAIGKSAAYAMRVVKGTLEPSEEVLGNWYEFRTGKRAIYAMAPVCPTCGSVHIAGDCHGREVASVVTLAPDEAVVKRNGHAAHKPRKPRATVQIEPTTREMLRDDKRAGESFDDVIRRWRSERITEKG